MNCAIIAFSKRSAVTTEEEGLELEASCELVERFPRREDEDACKCLLNAGTARPSLNKTSDALFCNNFREGFVESERI